MREAYIRAAARRAGLDPAAVLAIASHEGLSGGIGDGGHAFGPGQMNNAGGVITGRFDGMSPQQINKWAWSNQGINEWIRGMARVARGLEGKAAITAIATKYERPADPGAEIRDAMGAYGQYAKGGALPTGPNPGGGGSGGLGSNKRDLVQTLMEQNTAYANGGTQVQDPISKNAELVQMMLAKGQEPGRIGTPGQGQRMPTGQPGVIPKFAKIIGTPYSGTHTLGNWESDNAIDIAMPRGTPIRAVSNGTIGSQIGALNSSDPHMLGLRLHLVGKGNEYYYAHLSKLNVHAGQRVRKGDIIGWSGTANGVNHLHIGSKNGRPTGALRRWLF